MTTHTLSYEMVGFTKVSIVLASIFTIIGNAAAAPAPLETDVDKLIIAGVGLPKASELGLTVEDLKKPAPAVDHLFMRSPAPEKDLAKRFDPQCWGDPKCTRGDATNCYNYLNGLGGTSCVTSGYIQMCRSGGCGWYGRSLFGGTVSSSCYNVALGGAWVLTNCQGNYLAGANAAYGNGNLVVEIHP
ncbi:hypothetical protein Dda_9248 [Drechslerella dactyloides]|uniref:Uncharacterized protein n=1 Tax=Drechslerella dactyloides TaxID=74499 RepID=A0AAD6IT65_DREDA|nr:hypothetical protein Dda_9248 [Drechslerella dactyloides]